MKDIGNSCYEASKLSIVIIIFMPCLEFFEQGDSSFLTYVRILMSAYFDK
jgi:hypothetical protein